MGKWFGIAWPPSLSTYRAIRNSLMVFGQGTLEYWDSSQDIAFLSMSLLKKMYVMKSVSGK